MKLVNGEKAAECRFGDGEEGEGEGAVERAYYAKESE